MESKYFLNWLPSLLIFCLFSPASVLCQNDSRNTKYVSIPHYLESGNSTTQLWIEGGQKLKDESVEPASHLLKSESTAFSLSLFCTIVPIMIGVNSDVPEIGFAGLISGPAAGYIYADETKKGILGLLIRAGLLGATYILAESVSRDESSGSWGFHPTQKGVIIIVGISFTIFQAAIDISKVKGVVRKHNEAVR